MSLKYNRPTRPKIQVVLPGEGRKAATFINRLISHKDYGRRHRGKPIHCNPKSDIIALHKGKLLDRYGLRKRYVSSINLRHYAAHWAGTETMYYTATEEGDRLLIMVDVDCHAHGGPQEALGCVEWLKSHIFPGMYHEPSTNGQGRHGYIIVQRDGRSLEEVHDWLKRLQDHIRGYEHLHGVEMIELKGHPMRPVLDEDGVATDIRMGQLAKVPREVHNRLAEFQATTVVSVRDFVFGDVEDVEAKVPEAKVGSWDPIIVKPAKNFELVAKFIMRNLDTVKIDKKDIVYTVEDMAAGIAVGHACTKHPKPAKGSRWADKWIPGTMPTKRIKGLWEAAYKGGDIGRPWNHHRWTAIRNRLSQLGAINWEDNAFTPGKASMKWTFTTAFMVELDAAVEVSDTTFHNVSLSPQGDALDRLSAVLSWSEEYVVPEEVRSLLTAQAVEEDFEDRWDSMRAVA